MTKKVLGLMMLWVLLGLYLTLPVSAITQPSELKIYPDVQVYRNVLDTGDTLFIGKYKITYSGNESATDAYLIRVLDATGAALGATAPYSYHTLGYGDGMWSIYLGAGVVTWSAYHKIEISGNPMLDWGNTSVPKASSTDLDWNTTTSGMGTYLLTRARELDSSWGSPYDLEATGPEGTVSLTTQGVNYFSTVIPNLSYFCSSIFPITTTIPSYPKKVYTGSYASTLFAVWDVTAYSGYFSDLATYVTTTADTLKLIVFGLLVIATLVVIIQQVGSAGGWIMPILLAPLLYFGNWSGLLPMAITAMIAFMFVIMGVFVFFYKRATV